VAAESASARRKPGRDRRFKTLVRHRPSPSEAVSLATANEFSGPWLFAFEFTTGRTSLSVDTGEQRVEKEKNGLSNDKPFCRMTTKV